MAGHQAVMIRSQLSLGGFEGTTPVTQTHTDTLLQACSSPWTKHSSTL